MRDSIYTNHQSPLLTRPGLITAYQLARNLPRSTHQIKIIEKHPKSSQDEYGRAITLFPRSSEMLDQLGLAEQLAQQCFACRQTVNYDRNGKEVPGRGWSFMEEMKDTKWDFALVLRQKYQEDIFRQALRRHGIQLDAPYTLTSFELIDAVALGGFRILATIEHRDTKAKSVVKCRYLVGADGGKSFVRRAMKIPFDGSSTEDKWVRIDGVVETDMPKPRSYAAIESPTHGNVLWADPNEVLGLVMKEAATFSSGLGIYYEPDTCLTFSQSSGLSSIQAGQRAPDVPLQKPATFEATRLQTETPNHATFYIVVFAGEVAQTKPSLTAFTKAISGAKWLFDSKLPVQWLSVLAGPGGPSTFETLEGMPFGRVFYDEDHSAHNRYDIDLKKGTVFVFRPDGWVGTLVEMDESAVGKLKKYFSRFLVGLESLHKAKL